jgi:hypothetical protein
MRSVVVVLPASMCAMIPMLRIFSSGNVRGMWSVMAVWAVEVDLGSAAYLLPASAAFGHEKGPIGPVHDSNVGSGRVFRSAFPLPGYCTAESGHK